MTTSDQNQSQPQGGEGGTGTAAAPQAESGGAERGGARHGRRRHSGGGGGRRPEQQRQPQGQPSRRGESGLNIDELRELTELFSAHGLTDFEFENADIRIRLSRNPAPSSVEGFHAVAPHPLASPQASMHSAASAQQPAQGGAAPAPAGSESGAATTAATPAEAPEEELHVITAEMVGTFYRASSPQSEPFVKVGSQVEPSTVVCIIEAMKLMNEIEADVSGTIVKIFVENEQAVEYGQPLFGVKK